MTEVLLTKQSTHGQCWGVTEYMYRHYVFRIQIISNSYNLNSWYLESSYIVEINGLHDDTSLFHEFIHCYHTNGILCAPSDFGPLVQYLSVGVNATTSFWCAPNQPGKPP